MDEPKGSNLMDCGKEFPNLQLGVQYFIVLHPYLAPPPPLPPLSTRRSVI